MKRIIGEVYFLILLLIVDGCATPYPNVDTIPAKGQTGIQVAQDQLECREIERIKMKSVTDKSKRAMPSEFYARCMKAREYVGQVHKPASKKEATLSRRRITSEKRFKKQINASVPKVSWPDTQKQRGLPHVQQR